MASNIDPSKPAQGELAVKADLRANEQAAKDEIEALQVQTATLALLPAVLTTTSSVALVDPLIRAAGGGEFSVAAGALLKADSSGDLTITVNAADVSDRWNCTVVKWGTGNNVTIVAGTSLTLRSAGSPVIFAQHEGRAVVTWDGGVLWIS